jgi:catechol 2,3-dioxygenase-like lactoylglutathione lyase family enzyme
MLGYATIGTNDLPRALAFYDALLGEVGAKRLMETPHGFTMYGVTLRKPALAVTPPHNGKPATPGNGNMLALSLDARANVDALYKKALQLAVRMKDRPEFEARMDLARFMPPTSATRRETKSAPIGLDRRSPASRTPAASRLPREARLPPAGPP